MVATPLGYIRQLDGIRAVAVIFVILSHWLPNGIAGKFGFGAIGVDIFFVLSGFLITRVLIVERIKYELQPTVYSRLKAIKNFIVRRSLRIFPIYYLLLLLLIIFTKQFPNPLAQDWKWYFFYLQNILFYINKAWPGGKLSHLWSLAVEEQFYLFWPWLILFVYRKWLLKSIVISFFIGIASVYFMPMLRGESMAGLLTPSCMQAFASGGILSYLHIKMRFDFYKVEYYFLILALFSFSYLILGLIGFLTLLLDSRTLVSFIMVGLVSSILINPKSFLSLKLLGNPALVFFGKISYGVYLFHNFIPIWINALLHKLEKNDFTLTFLKYNKILVDQSILFYVISFSFLLFVATSSFYIFENPINKFKRYFI